MKVINMSVLKKEYVQVDIVNLLAKKIDVLMIVKKMIYINMNIIMILIAWNGVQKIQKLMKNKNYV